MKKFNPILFLLFIVASLTFAVPAFAGDAEAVEPEKIEAVVPDAASGEIVVENIDEAIAEATSSDVTVEQAAEPAADSKSTNAVDSKVIETQTDEPQTTDSQVSDNQPDTLATILFGAPAGAELDAQDTGNGYYSVSFKLSEDNNKKAFITGLTLDNVKLIKDELVSCWASGEDFSFINAGFIDAEKTGEDDTQLCWAAAASNILQYTGWAKEMGLSSEDDVLQLFTEGWKDEGGWPFAGITWILDGSASSSSAEAKITDYSIGGLAKQYPSEQVSGYEAIDDSTSYITLTSDALTHLQKNDGVDISIAWLYADGTYTSTSHEITLWGMVYDDDISADEAGHYLAFITSDSDDDYAYSDDRTKAPNRYYIRYLKPVDTATGTRYELQGSGALTDFTWLIQYSSAIKAETSTDATLDKRNTFDLSTDYEYPYVTLVKSTTSFPSNSEFEITPLILNIGDSFYQGNITVKVDIVSKTSGETVFSKTYDEEIDAPTFAVGVYSTPLKIDGLAAGEYTLTYVLNQDHSALEAYYINNTYSYDITVSDIPYDTSKMTFDVDISKLDEETMTYDETFIYSDAVKAMVKDLTDKDENVSINIYVSEYDSMKNLWGNWIEVLLDQDALPETYTLYHGPEQVRYLLQISADSIPTVSIYSKEHFLYQKEIVFQQATFNLRIESGQSEDIDGYHMMAIITNNDLNKAEIKDYSVEFIGIQGDKIVSFGYSTPVNVAYHEQVSCVLSSVKNTANLRGRYDVVAIARYNGNEFRSPTGTISFEEEKSLVVNSNEMTIDKFDSLTTLPEAIAYYYETGGSLGPVVIEEVGFYDVTEGFGVDRKLEITSTTKEAIIRYMGNDNGAIFNVSNSGELVLDGVYLSSTNSDVTGVIVNKGGIIRINNSALSNNSATKEGGVINSDGGFIDIRNSQFTYDACFYTPGAVIYAYDGCKIEVRNSTFSACRVSTGIIYNEEGDVTLVGCTFEDNDLYGDNPENVVCLDGKLIVVDKEEDLPDDDPVKPDDPIVDPDNGNNESHSAYVAAIGQSAGVKTSDNNSPYIWCGIIFVSLVGIVFVDKKRKYMR